jgi:hypothetical protein
MHDPMIVAFEIRRPWPQRSAFRKQRHAVEDSALPRSGVLAGASTTGPA